MFDPKKIIENKYVLYIILFVTITNVLSFVYLNNIDALIFFIIIGLLSTFFSKNMTINLLTSIIATNIFATHTFVQEGMETKKKEKKKEKMKNKKKKANKKQGFAPINEEEDMEIGKRIDYASTLEQAYSNLENVLGKEGMSGLTKETEQLVNQQKSLMTTMKDIGPMVNMAKKTLSGLDMGNLKETLSNVTGMMNTLKGNK